MQKDNRTSLLLSFVGYAFILIGIISVFMVIKDHSGETTLSSIVAAGSSLTMGLILLGLKEIINILERKLGA